ncbi:hypothetical protein KEM52_002283 [Ascosphaera acerosa]|nr:hypothetical protein KEM52_002283 [Ascosphaera acerosa]
MQVWESYMKHDKLRGLAEANDPALNALITAFIAVAMYNAIELLVLTFSTFVRYNTLYFWSMTCTTVIGVWCSALGFTFLCFEVINSATVFGIVLPIVWTFLVTGHSLVLYSRLHLVVYNPRVLRAVLTMIVVDGVILHTSTVAVSVASVAEYNQNGQVETIYGIVERIEITWFSVQEIIIAVVYIYHTLILLRGLPSCERRKNLKQLLSVNVSEIAMDICLVTLQYCGIFLLQMVLKVMVYSIKLKLEFAVLRQLVKFSHVTELSSQTMADDPPAQPIEMSSSPSSRGSIWRIESLIPFSSKARKGSGNSGRSPSLPPYSRGGPPHDGIP